MPTTGTSIENGATVLDGCRPMSAVHSPVPTSVATTTVKSSPASASSPCVLPRPWNDPAIAAGPSTTSDSASSGRGGTTDIHSSSRNGSPGCACMARRLPRLPTAQPSPPHSVSRTGTSVAPPASPARCAAMPAEADDGEQDPGALPGGDALAQEHPGQQHRERRGRLQDQRRQPGRHAAGHRQVEEHELQDAEPEAVQQDPAPAARWAGGPAGSSGPRGARTGARRGRTAGTARATGGWPGSSGPRARRRRRRSGGRGWAWSEHARRAIVQHHRIVMT